MQLGLYAASGNKYIRDTHFYGLNRQRRSKQGEFEDMENMSSAEFPCISPRKGRIKAADAPGKISAVCPPSSENDTELVGFTGIANGAFYYNGKKKSKTFSLPDSFKWEILRMGNLYIINGFKKGTSKENYSSIMYYYNSDTEVFDVANKGMDNLILIAGKDSTGNYLSTFRYGFDEVKAYVAASEDGRIIKNMDFYDTYSGGKSVLPKNNIFAEVFEVGDEVSLSGFPTEEENFGQVWSYDTSEAEVIPQTNQDFSANNTADTDAYASLAEIGDGLIVRMVVNSFNVSTFSYSGITAYIHKIYLKLYNKNGEETDFEDMNGSIKFYCSGMKLEKRTRHFDNIACHNGRIWGTVPNGNMIYGSSSDDIFSFSSEDIRSGYAARLTSENPGGFTAMCEYGSELVLFKEDSITVIYGDSVRNYGKLTINGIGCTDKRSVQVTPSGVIFLAYGGFYIYSGGVPVCISQKLNRTYTAAVCGFDGDIYYACVSEDGAKTILTYDMRYGIWHKQDSTDAYGFFRFRDGFYIADENSIYRMNSGACDCGWSFTSVNRCVDTTDNKAVNGLWICTDTAEGTELVAETSIDGGIWRRHGIVCEPGLRVYHCPVRAVMGKNFRYRISGKGEAVFYEIRIDYAGGGRRFKEYEA